MKEAPSLSQTVQALLASGKGFLAADESFPTLEKRFKEFAIPFTEENRRDYRELLFTTPGLSDFISGVILFDETLHQTSRSGLPLPEELARQGIVPGIKVDLGTVALAGFADETITQGLDGLRERLAQYRELGARFTKWRAVIKIGAQLPTWACIAANARTLALFAALSQEAGLVPIVEPEVLMNGGHPLARCEEVITATLKAVFEALFEHRIVLEHMLLKTGMVLPGQDCPVQAGTEEVASATVRCLRRAVPAAVPGIVFLSGGQSELAATERLNAIVTTGPLPWKLTFSYGRALQDSALRIWRGSPGSIAAAQAALHHRARCNSLATQGRYSEEAELIP